MKQISEMEYRDLARLQDGIETASLRLENFRLRLFAEYGFDPRAYTLEVGHGAAYFSKLAGAAPVATAPENGKPKRGRPRKVIPAEVEAEIGTKVAEATAG